MSDQLVELTLYDLNSNKYTYKGLWLYDKALFLSVKHAQKFSDFCVIEKYLDKLKVTISNNMDIKLVAEIEIKS